MVIDKLSACVVVWASFETSRKIELGEIDGDFGAKKDRNNNEDIGKINFKTLKRKQFKLQEIIEGDMPVVVAQTQHGDVNGQQINTLANQT